MRKPRAFPLILTLVSFWIPSVFGYDYWRHMIHPEALLDPLPYEVVHFSSFARNGGNGDYGQYQGTDVNGWKILCDVAGPGVLAEFWYTKSPLPDTCRFRIYIDDTLHAVLDTQAIRLCGQVEPFIAPLADSSLRARYSYVPIPFQNRLRITYRGVALIYHGNILRLEPDTPVESFTIPPSADYLLRLDSLRYRFLNYGSPSWWTTASTVDLAGDSTIPALSQAVLLNHSGHGGVRQILMRVDSRTQSALENVWVKVSTDHSPHPDFYAPISTLFGASLGWWTYRSEYTGMRGDTLYLNLPIPFRSELHIEIENHTDSARYVQAWAQIADVPFSELGTMKLKGVFHDSNPTVLWSGHEVANVTGAGTSLGILLDIQANTNQIYEGDEYIWRNGELSPSWWGTGTSDYFNGGYYWQARTCLASHGCIRFATTSAAPYRWNITDPVPFTNGFRMKFDVGAYNQFNARYRSLALFAVPRKRWQIADADGDGQSTPGEVLHIVGQGLNPGIELVSITGDRLLFPYLSGDTVVSADSILDVFVTAADEPTDREITIRAQLKGGTEIVADGWTHLWRPMLTYAVHRSTADSSQCYGDTLGVTITGLSEGDSAQIWANGTEIPWAVELPFANSAGMLNGKVMIPENLFSADYSLQGTSTGHLTAYCPFTLKIRAYYLAEIDEMPITLFQTSVNEIRYGPDYTAAGNPSVYGRNLARFVQGQGIGSYAECRFATTVADSVRSGYFFGLTGGGCRLRITLDSLIDVDDVDTYFTTPGGYRWTRSDTIWGNWQFLPAGEHTLRFEIIGRNESSTNWQFILDQLILSQSSGISPRTPAAVTGVTTRGIGTGVRLRWRPVTTDTEGSPLTPTAYAIYRALGPDSIFRLIAEVPGTTTMFLDEEAPGNGGTIVLYAITARIGTASPPAVRESAIGRAFLPVEAEIPASKK